MVEQTCEKNNQTNKEVILERFKDMLQLLQLQWNHMITFFNSDDSHIHVVLNKLLKNNFSTDNVFPDYDMINNNKSSENNDDITSVFKKLYKLFSNKLKLLLETLKVHCSLYVDANQNVNKNHIISNKLNATQKSLLKDDILNSLIDDIAQFLLTEKKKNAPHAAIISSDSEDEKENMSENEDEYANSMEEEDFSSSEDEDETHLHMKALKGKINTNQISIDSDAIKNFKLYSHQKNAISFLKQQKNNNLGGILYHDMGLGKTKTSCYYAIKTLKQNSGLIMAIVPKSTIQQWIFEFAFIMRFLKIKKDEIQLFNMGYHDPQTLQSILRNPPKKGIVVTTMSQLRLENKNKQLIQNKNMYSMIIIDEIHQLKNVLSNFNRSSSQLPQYVKTIQLLRHAVTTNGQIFGLTGTPIISSLTDLCASLWITKVIKGTLTDAYNKCDTLDDDEIKKLFLKNAHKVSQQELSEAKKPIEEIKEVIVTYSTNDQKNIIEQNMKKLRLNFAKMKASKNAIPRRNFL